MSFVEMLMYFVALAVVQGLSPRGDASKCGCRTKSRGPLKPKSVKCTFCYHPSGVGWVDGDNNDLTPACMESCFPHMTRNNILEYKEMVAANRTKLQKLRRQQEARNVVRASALRPSTTPAPSTNGGPTIRVGGPYTGCGCGDNSFVFCYNEDFTKLVGPSGNPLDTTCYNRRYFPFKQMKSSFYYNITSATQQRVDITRINEAARSNIIKEMLLYKPSSQNFTAAELYFLVRSRYHQTVRDDSISRDFYTFIEWNIEQRNNFLEQYQDIIRQPEENAEKLFAELSTLAGVCWGSFDFINGVRNVP